MRRRMIGAALVAGMVVAFAMPAVATVDEITGMPCSGGNAIFGPPGITGGSKADNFAQPLIANGFATLTAPYVGHGDGLGDDVLVSLDENHPASKIRLLGPIVEVEPGRFLTVFEWDDTKPFANCAKFAQPTGP